MKVLFLIMIFITILIMINMVTIAVTAMIGMRMIIVNMAMMSGKIVMIATTTTTTKTWNSSWQKSWYLSHSPVLFAHSVVEISCSPPRIKRFLIFASELQFHAFVFSHLMGLSTKSNPRRLLNHITKPIFRWVILFLPKLRNSRDGRCFICFIQKGVMWFSSTYISLSFGNDFVKYSKAPKRKVVHCLISNAPKGLVRQMLPSTDWRRDCRMIIPCKNKQSHRFHSQLFWHVVELYFSV